MEQYQLVLPVITHQIIENVDQVQQIIALWDAMDKTHVYDEETQSVYSVEYVPAYGDGVKERRRKTPLRIGAHLYTRGEHFHVSSHPISSVSELPHTLTRPDMVEIVPPADQQP